jgi:hypothetical protein
MSRALFGLGLILFVIGVWFLSPDLSLIENASDVPGQNPAAEPSYVGWGALVLAFLSLASSHYFKLQEKRRADRAEARAIEDGKQRAQRSRKAARPKDHRDEGGQG